ncbi:MAG: cytochrome C biogenesis protein ResB, partial [Corynebacterium sp.]|nr:cytochrome C biogenesis protein ResB [Corynebacterium sp.]
TDGEQNTQDSVFCNTATANFDSFRAGANFDGTGLTTFCFEAHDFSADYLPSGQAEMFRSNISYAVGDDIFNDPDTWTDYELRVNHPLRVEGDRVYLQGHGFAPTFTVTWPNGETRTQTVQWRPDDLTFFLSSGVMRFDPPAGLYPDLFDRRQNQLAIQGLFAPTAEWSGENGELLTSSYPAMRDPAVAIDIYRGDNGLDTGRGQQLFSLDPSLMHSGQLQKIERVNLQVGDTVTLDDGTEITFDGASEFANYQISRDPTQNWVLVTTVISLAALVGSLTVRRRRIWVRMYPQPDGTTRVETGGLARTDRAGWGAEYEDFHRELLGLEDTDEDEEVYFDDADRD